MKRFEALTAIYDQLRDRIVVTITGAVAAELRSLGQAVGPSAYVTDLSLLENRFPRSLRS